MVQDKELSTSKEKTNLTKLLWAGKLLITIFIISYIYKTFQNEKKGIADVAEVFTTILSVEHLPVIITMIFLVPVNWALESIKWQRLVRKITAISFSEAFRGTLTGLAVGVAAPAQLGDTIGRVAALKSNKRLEAIGAAVVSNGIQFYVSVIAGTIGWYYLYDSISLPEVSKSFMGPGLCVLIMAGWIVAFFRRQLVNWNPQRKVFQSLHAYLRIIGTYTAADLLTATACGFARYLVFLSQFLLAFSFFDFPLSIFTIASCISIIFLAKTLIPAINVLGDLGLREFTALFVFQQYNLPPEQIITATFAIWIINVMGPILIGIFLIWKYKWQQKND